MIFVVYAYVTNGYHVTMPRQQLIGRMFIQDEEVRLPLTPEGIVALEDKILKTHNVHVVEYVTIISWKVLPDAE